jgi:phosphatidate phosphatase APP1
MVNRDSAPWRILSGAQRRWDRLKLEIKRRLHAVDPLTLLAYRSHAGHGKIRVVGRLIEESGVEPPDQDGNVLRNVANALRRFESDEIPDGRVVARYDGAELEGTTDHEGYFEINLEVGAGLEPGWHEVEIELLDSPAGGAGTRCTAEALVPDPAAEFAVISDVDDTVLKSRSTDTVTQLRLLLSQSARERSPMPGATPLYRLLEGGPDGEGSNPFFYVSNSGWALYDLMAAFLDYNQLPKGPLYLQDLAILEPKSPRLGSTNHKRDTMDRLFHDYPDLSFVLVGDSGQQDPETYRDVVQEHTERVRAVLIRDVAPPERDSEVRVMIQEMVDLGVPAAAAESSVSLARAAADFGLIPEDGIAEVREGMVRKRGE